MAGNSGHLQDALSGTAGIDIRASVDQQPGDGHISRGGGHMERSAVDIVSGIDPWSCHEQLPHTALVLGNMQGALADGVCGIDGRASVEQQGDCASAGKASSSMQRKLASMVGSMDKRLCVGKEETQRGQVAKAGGPVDSSQALAVRGSQQRFCSALHKSNTLLLHTLLAAPLCSKRNVAVPRHVGLLP